MSFTATSVISQWNNCENQDIVIQEYLSRPDQLVQKLRVFWHLEGGCQYVLITKTQKLPADEPKGRRNNRSSTMNYNAFRHKIKDYYYAGRLLKSSFNPWLPRKPILPAKKAVIVKKRTISKQHSEKKLPPFILKSSLEKALTEEIEEVPFVRSQMNEIISVLNLNLKEAIHQSITELVADFVPDGAGNWYFLECKWYRSAFIFSKSSLNLLKDIALPNADTSLNSSMISSGVNTIETRIRQLSIKSQAFMKKCRKYDSISLSNPMQLYTPNMTGFIPLSLLSVLPNHKDREMPNRLQRHSASLTTFTHDIQNYTSYNGTIEKLLKRILTDRSLKDLHAKAQYASFLFNCKNEPASMNFVEEAISTLKPFSERVKGILIEECPDLAFLLNND